ncbi:tetratricopeptide repeat protein, partial [Flavobacteriales bacterium]|nr:tetratricopeptide repeat protein [Flavobacteriales bacterium]
MIPFYLRLLPFLWLTPALAQQELSPLIQDWNDKTRSVEDRLQTAKDLHIEFHQTYPDTVLFYLEEMRELAERSDQPLALYSAYNRIGSLHQMQGQEEEAMAAYEQAEQVALALGDSLRLGTVYGNRGNVYVQLNKYVDATRHFNRAIELYTVAG